MNMTSYIIKTHGLCFLKVNLASKLINIPRVLTDNDSGLFSYNVQ